MPLDSEAASGNIPALATLSCWRRDPLRHFLLLLLKSHSSAPHLPPPLPGWGWEVADGNTGGCGGI